MSEDRDSFVPEEYLKNVRYVRPVLGLRSVVGMGLIASGVAPVVAFSWGKVAGRFP